MELREPGEGVSEGWKVCRMRCRGAGAGVGGCGCGGGGDGAPPPVVSALQEQHLAPGTCRDSCVQGSPNANLSFQAKVCKAGDHLKN